MNRRLRVLLIAEACNPEWASVPLVGWSHSQAIAALTDAHLVTQIRNRAAFLRAGLVEDKDFTAIDSELVTRPLRWIAGLFGGKDGKGWTTLAASAALYYYYFEHVLWRKFGERIIAGEFDIVHRLTPLSPAVPSLLAKRCQRAGVPFVLGPLNGGVPWPRGFDSSRRKEREWLSYVRGAYRLLPGYHSTRRNSSAIFIGSKDTLAQMPMKYHPRCQYLPENGVDLSRFKLVRTHKAAKPLRVVFVGRLVPYKGADMLLEALLPLIHAGSATLDVLGDGPMMESLRDRVEKEGVVERVRLHGWVEHSKIEEHLSQADVFGFPSIREFGGGVVLEAMAVGVPPLVVRYGGPGELVTPETGWLVEMGSRQEIVDRFRAVFTQLCAEPGLVDAKSESALKLVRENFTWNAKARQVVQLYDQLVLPKEKSAMPEDAICA